MDDLIGRKEFAENMRKISKNLKPPSAEWSDDIVIRVSFELWEKLADMIESGVEVVRCKDCKFMDERKENWFCDVWGYYGAPTPNAYCSYGERKEKGDGRT